jgi:hypothetical protein
VSLCLVSGSLFAALPLTAFTLAWTHSIEKTRWEEDWIVREQILEIREARIRGSGAGMEPPAGARLENGIWHYVPAQARHVVLRLTHSPHAAGYELCTDRGCRLLADLLPGLKDNPDTTAVIELTACSEGARS